MTENHKAFANVTTLRLSAAYQLHSCSLNPHKDLIALHRNLSWSQADERKQSRHATSIGFGLASLLRKDRILTKFRGKGKEREEDEDEKAGSIAVGIWRTNPGVQIDESISLPSLAQPVWEIDILGRYLAGLVWSNDGMVLSLLVSVQFHTISESKGYKLVHLSVHDGTVLATSYLNETYSDLLAGEKRFDLYWASNSSPYEARPELGSSDSTISSLKGIDPVNEFVPAAARSSSRQNDTTSSIHSPQTHRILSSFPQTLQEINAQDVLCIPQFSTGSGRGLSFIGGAFPLPFCPAIKQEGFEYSYQSGPSPAGSKEGRSGFQSYVDLARSSSVMKNHLNIVLQGLQNCSAIWREGIDTERQYWVDELRDAAKSHGATFDHTHADLTRLLLTGRSGEAVAQFLGGRVTEGALSKWETLHYSAVEQMKKIVLFSVDPAAERLILLLEYLGKGTDDDTQISLDPERLEQCEVFVSDLLCRASALMSVLDEETKLFRQFGKWLRYEIARAATGGSDEDYSVTAAHNVTMVMDYLQNVMTGTRLNAFFLSMDDQIDANWPIPIPVSTPAPIPLGSLLKWYRGPALGQTEGPSPPNYASNKAQPRQIWPIADALTHHLETILRSSVQGCSIGDPQASEMRWKAQLEKRGKIAIRRHEDEVETVSGVFAPTGGQIVYFLRYETHADLCYYTTRSLHTDITILEFTYFDAEELLILFDRASMPVERIFCILPLVTIDVKAESNSACNLEQCIQLFSTGTSGQPSNRRDLFHNVTRSRSLRYDQPIFDSPWVAANGRLRRRMACVTCSRGSEIEILELDVDEDSMENEGYDG